MNYELPNNIVAAARVAHANHWKKGDHVGTQTRAAHAVCKAWQETVRYLDLPGIQVECPVGSGMNEKIDIVDTTIKIAYELKSSPNNTHMEFYRDIFKSLVYNKNHPNQAVATLVFLTPKAGNRKLKSRFAADVIELMAKENLTVELADLD